MKSSSPPSPKPSFFKLMFPNTNNRKLMIPQKFVSMHEKDVSNCTLLLKVKGPSRDPKTWQVESIKRGHQVWLQKGWQQFAGYYSLCDAPHFLTFILEANSTFSVAIFDESATEIEYPPELSREGTHADAPIVLDGETMKPTRTTSQRGGFGKLKFPKREDGEDVPTKERRVGSKAYTETALERAKAFKTSNPSFIKTMFPTSAGPGYVKLSIPFAFAKTNFREKNASVDLWVLDNGRRRTWTVRSSVRRADADLNCGWGEFKQDNNLKVGDVCVFEQVKGENYVFEVNIFRAN